MRNEIPITFDCAGDELVGVIHEGRPEAGIGIVFIVGGPQYRIGSHRQFVLMAREFAKCGFPVIRFDCRGMGDSHGVRCDFTELGSDIHAAIDCLQDRMSGLTHVVLLGLCDGASAAMIHAPSDQRVIGQILMNPWVRTEAESEKVRLRHYYLPRMLKRSFWIKILSGKGQTFKSIAGLLRSLRIALSRERPDIPGGLAVAKPFVHEMLSGVMRFQHQTLFLLSGKDLVAKEFLALCKANPHWQEALENSRTKKLTLLGADHTLSKRQDLDRAVKGCIDWIQQTRRSI